MNSRLNFTQLSTFPLFKNISEKELPELLERLHASIRHFKKEEIIYHAGDLTTRIGAILTGRVHIIKEDFWGNRSILSEVPSGRIFSETYAVLTTTPLEVSVLAVQDTDILFLDIQAFLKFTDTGRGFHGQLFHNLLAVAANKNLILTRKLEYLAQKTTRDKLLAYLSAESLQQNSSSFEISFNRQQLADYLSVDRSAMSNELSKMQKEGLISFKKNHFTLLLDE